MYSIQDLKSVVYTTTPTGGYLGLVKEDDRALIKTNPTGELGASGIYFHTYADSFFYSTITVATRDLQTGKWTPYYLNIASTIKWLNAQLPNHEKIANAAAARDRDSIIIYKINQLATILLKQKEKQGALEIEMQANAATALYSS